MDRDVLEELETKISFPVISYFEDITSFFETDQPNIINYFAGQTQIADAQSFKNLDALLFDTQRLFESFSFNKNILSNIKYWELIEIVEQYENVLLSLSKAYKWLRSTSSKANFNPNPEIDIALKQGHTLERVSREILGGENWDNNWDTIALKNDLKEEDYTSEGGKLLKVNFNSDSSNINIRSVVDSIQGERILGIDLDKKLTFEDDDLKTLSPKDTFIQSIQTLANLFRGANPEFPDQGVNKKMVIGSNVNTLSYPSLFRQITETFSTDDTIKAFTITEFKKDQDGIFLSFQVQSKLNDVQNISTRI